MIRIPVAKDWEAEIQEPNRGEFDDNLGGAVEYTFTHFIYKVLEFAGGSIGVFLGGAIVKFLDTVEPHMVKYVSPLIDGLLDIPEMPEWLRDYLKAVKSPEDEVGAALLASAGGAVVGGVVGSLFGTLLAGPTQALNKGLRLTIPDPGSIYALGRRGLISWEEVDDYMARIGYHDRIGGNLNEVLRPRASEGALLESVRRGDLEDAAFRGELKDRGYPTIDANLIGLQRETLMDVGNIIRGYHRGDVTDPDAKILLGKLGFKDSTISLILSNAEVIPGVGDLVQMAVREAWDDGIADRYKYDADFSTEFGDWVEKQGMDRGWAQKYWRAHWQLPSVTLGFDMYHRGIIGEGELKGLLRTADYPAGWRDKMVSAAYHPITRVDVRRFYRLGILSYEQLIDRYKMLGYNQEDATLMADFTVKYESPDPEDEAGKVRELTRGVIEKAYRLGKITRDEAVTKLLELRYDEDSINLSLSLVDMQIELDSIPDYMEDYRKDLSNLILKSYTKRMIDPQSARGYLLELGLDEREIPLKLQVADYAYSEAMKDHGIDLVGESYVKRVITETDAYGLLGGLDLTGAQQSQILGEWDMERNLRTRQLTEAQYRRALTKRLLTPEDYTEAMRGLGYNERDVGILTQMAIETEE